MIKERHKGQFKQRGADKKQQRANPFWIFLSSIYIIIAIKEWVI